MAVAHNFSPSITIYKRSGDTFTKLPNPSITPTNAGSSVVFSNDVTYLVVGHQSSPFITIYKRSGDTFTKLADPSVLPGLGQAFTAYGIDFSSDDTYLAVGHGRETLETIPLTIYKRSGDTFTQLSNPLLTPAAYVLSVAFSPGGTYLAATDDVFPFLFIYKRDGDTFTKLANPNDLPTGTGNAVAFSPDGNYLAVASGGFNPTFRIYKREGDFFTKLPNPGVLPEFPYSVTFSSDSNYLAVGAGVSPRLLIYRREGDIFTKVNDPDVIPAGPGFGVSFNPNGLYLAVSHSTTPFVTVYKTTIGRNAYIQALKANNTLHLTSNITNLGYALESSNTVQTKTIMSLFAQLTDQPIEFLLTTAPTGQLSSPPPVFLRVGFVNPTNQTVQVEALLFRADTPETLLGVNLLPTTLAPGESFGPSDVATAGGNSGLHTLTLRMKEAGKAFSAIVEVSVDIVDEGDGGFTFA